MNIVIKRTIDIDPIFYVDCALEDIEEHLRDNLEQDYSLSPTDRATDEVYDQVYCAVLKALNQKTEELLKIYDESEEN